MASEPLKHVHPIHNYLPKSSEKRKEMRIGIGIGIGKFPVINSQELQIGKFLTGQGRREDRGGGGGIGTGNKINLIHSRAVSVSVNFRLSKSEK